MRGDSLGIRALCVSQDQIHVTPGQANEHPFRPTISFWVRYIPARAQRDQAEGTVSCMVDTIQRVGHRIRSLITVRIYYGRSSKFPFYENKYRKRRSL